MGILEMSLYGAVMIIAVVLIRTVAVNRLPKRTFVILWSIVLIRLLLPFEIPSNFSVYSLIGSDMAAFVESAKQSVTELDNKERQSRQTASDSQTIAVQPFVEQADKEMAPLSSVDIDGNVESAELPDKRAEASFVFSSLPRYVASHELANELARFLYGIGVVLCVGYFAVAYLRCRVEFGMSLPVCDAYVERWLEERRMCGGGSGRLSGLGRFRLRRFRSAVTVRVSDRIDTPLTYGVMHPVILLPKKTAWENREQLTYVLWHEYTHICRGDSALKMLAAVALSVHWFNPLVWVMYVLLNRDIELACDESVVHRCGISDKSAYAKMLIAMEEKRSGLLPLCNNFSQNAIEERVRAIMKIKKFSLGAVIFAVGMVAGVATAFATSAGNVEEVQMAEKKMAEREINEAGDYTEEEWDMLYALRFDGYADMSVSAFQDKVWTLTDTEAYTELLSRLEHDETLYELRGHNDMADYLFNVMEPLTGERWQEQRFDCAVSVSGKGDLQEETTYNMAILEYEMTLRILDADAVTVGDYTAARLEMADRISNMMLDYTADALADEEQMQEEIESQMYALTSELSTEELHIDVSWVYQPSGVYSGSGNTGECAQSPEEWERNLEAEEQALYAAYQEEFQKELEAVLKPYLPFGLTYEYDTRADDFKMYFDGREVRGILDENQGTIITAHTGISTYARDATEVYAVYDEEGKLTGLRTATKEEQEDWDLRRRQSTEELRGIEEEVRDYMPGTSEDYELILSLKKTNYEKMTLADFDSALIDWANEHSGSDDRTDWANEQSDSYDRIECDRIWDDFRVNLPEEDKEFITRTVYLSGMENAMLIRSLHRGMSEEEAEDVSIGDTLTKNPGDEAPQYTWCQMYYSFSYHVSDKEKVTVGERDRAVGGMLDGIEDFWEETDMEELLRMDKNDILQKLNELAAKHSTKNITITVEEDQIGFECMDERALMQEE